MARARRSLCVSSAHSVSWAAAGEVVVDGCCSRPAGLHPGEGRSGRKTSRESPPLLSAAAAGGPVLLLPGLLPAAAAGGPVLLPPGLLPAAAAGEAAGAPDLLDHFEPPAWGAAPSLRVAWRRPHLPAQSVAVPAACAGGLRPRQRLPAASLQPRHEGMWFKFLANQIRQPWIHTLIEALQCQVPVS